MADLNFLTNLADSRQVVDTLIRQAQDPAMNPGRNSQDRETLAVCGLAAAVVYLGDVLLMTLETSVAVSEDENGDD